jgi:hypothetical protein
MRCRDLSTWSKKIHESCLPPASQWTLRSKQKFDTPRPRFPTSEPGAPGRNAVLQSIAVKKCLLTSPSLLSKAIPSCSLIYFSVIPIECATRRDAEITAQTYYRWRKEFGGLKLDQAQAVTEYLVAATRLGQNGGWRVTTVDLGQTRQVDRIRLASFLLCRTLV